MPGANDKVLVGSGTNVTYDAQSDASLNCVSVEGALRFRNNATTRIKVGNLMVKDGGVLEVGTSASPIPAGVTAEIIIADKPLDTNFDPEAVRHRLHRLWPRDHARRHQVAHASCASPPSRWRARTR